MANNKKVKEAMSTIALSKVKALETRHENDTKVVDAYKVYNQSLADWCNVSGFDAFMESIKDKKASELTADETTKNGQYMAEFADKKTELSKVRSDATKAPYKKIRECDKVLFPDEYFGKTGKVIVAYENWFDARYTAKQNDKKEALIKVIINYLENVLKIDLSVKTGFKRQIALNTIDYVGVVVNRPGRQAKKGVGRTSAMAGNDIKVVVFDALYAMYKSGRVVIPEEETVEA